MKAILLMSLTAMMAVATAEAKTVEATLDLGDFEGSEQQISGQNLEQAPFNFYYAHSGTQVIYKAAEIAPLFEHGASVESITFRYGDPDWTTWFDFSESLTCYMQLIDEDHFTVVDNKSKWFAPEGEPALATATLDYTSDMTGYPFEITLKFETPFVVSPDDKGKNLLLTSTSDITEGDSDAGQYVRPYVYNNADRDHRMACYGYDGSDDDFMEAVKAGGEISTQKHSDVYKYDLPVARIAYTYTKTSTAIEDIEACEGGETRVYDISGVAVGLPADKLPKGLYIVRSGGRAEKMLVR